jgi:hypothetical protein
MKSHRFAIGTAPVTALVTLTLSAAHAAPVIYNNEATFRAAAGLTTTYSFETHGVEENVEHLDAPFTAVELDSHFELAQTNLNSFKIIDDAGDPGAVDGTHFLFTHSRASAMDYSLVFSNFGAASASITAFGLTVVDFASGLGANHPPARIVYEAGPNRGTLLSVEGEQTDYTQNFVGVIVDPGEAFASIRLTLDDINSGFQSFDEVIYSQVAAQVPQPPSIALFGAGLLGFAWSRRRMN